MKELGRSTDAHAAWRALIEGRWSLVDHFDHRGRRFLVARPSRTGRKRSDATSAREQQVLAFTVMGHANKRIAYELGLPESTVSAALRTVATKFGARSRIDLIRMFASCWHTRPRT